MIRGLPNSSRKSAIHITYGSVSTQQINGMRQPANEFKTTADATTGTQADRAVNKAVNPFFYDGDLVQDIENEDVKED